MIQGLLRFLPVSLIMAVTGIGCAQDAPRTPEDLEKWGDASLWDLEARDIDGAMKPLGQWKGKVAVVVNLASRCGYTAQYAKLQALHDSMKDLGVVVLGFPCNQFGGQEPGTPEEIKSFCTSRFGVTFPLFDKVEVKSGPRQSDVYALLGTQSGKLPGWNFSKYVVGSDGKAVAFFPSNVAPDDPRLRSAVEKALASAERNDPESDEQAPSSSN